jgi:hypothetical protein
VPIKPVTVFTVSAEGDSVAVAGDLHFGSSTEEQCDVRDSRDSFIDTIAASFRDSE